MPSAFKTTVVVTDTKHYMVSMEETHVVTNYIMAILAKFLWNSLIQHLINLENYYA